MRSLPRTVAVSDVTGIRGLGVDAIWRGPAQAAQNEDDAAEDSVTAGSIAGDLAIIEQARLDPAAFAPLYERYFPAVHGYCRRRITDRDLAADATSEIFSRAIAALPRFRPQPSRPDAGIRSWLFTIAHNVVVDHHRRYRPSQSLDHPPPRELTPPQLIDGSFLPEQHVIASDERRQLHRLLTQLTENQRRVTELRLAGLTGVEIAAILGLTTGAVKAVQFRAHSRLRDLIGASETMTNDGNGEA